MGIDRDLDPSNAIRIVLERLLASSNAVAAVFVGEHLVVQAGAFTAKGMLYLKLLRAPEDLSSKAALESTRAHIAELIAVGFDELQGRGAAFHMQHIREHGALAVIFDERASRDSVRSATREAALFVGDVLAGHATVPPAGGTPPSGASAMVAVGIPGSAHGERTGKRARMSN